MAPSEQERARLLELAEMFGNAASKFETLVGTKDAKALLVALSRYTEDELRQVLLTRVLIDQHHAEPPDDEQPPSEHVPTSQ